MDDVELTPARQGEQGLLLLGATAPKLLQQLGLPGIEPLRYALATLPDGDALLLTGQSYDEPHYELQSHIGAHHIAFRKKQ